MTQHGPQTRQQRPIITDSKKGLPQGKLGLCSRSDVAIEEGLIQSFFRHTKDDRRMVGGGRFLTDDDLKTA
ncbi:MAG: hypothetical protein WBF93_21000, partial [Pirellulales bacterium]